MTEFGDRIRAQRDVLRIVNAVAWKEGLFGLSIQAIRRWAEQNGMPSESQIVTELRAASERLGFLANRSQMQVSEEYRRAWQDMERATRNIEAAIRALAGV